MSKIIKIWWRNFLQIFSYYSIRQTDLEKLTTVQSRFTHRKNESSSDTSLGLLGFKKQQ